VRPKSDTAAIIVAGGKGLRFGGRVRKQYLLLKGKPLMWWSLRAFEKSPSIGAMILVAPADDVLRLAAQITAWRFRKFRNVVAGGASRSDSVRAGLSAVPVGLRFVAVHDAVRPLITSETIEKVIAAARRSKAALAATPSKDTVKLADSKGYVHATPDRTSVWLAQTPQVFERRLLERAHSVRGSGSATDDAMLVERLGVKVTLVESPADNIKITRPVDLELAKCIVSA
jgi:2-C-methyl-D-erythritol 4-phosphate cytidylyltransferase